MYIDQLDKDQEEYAEDIKPILMKANNDESHMNFKEFQFFKTERKKNVSN